MVAGTSPSSSELKVGPTLDRTPFHLRKTLTHPHSLSLGQCRHTVHLTCTPLGCGKKPESPEKIPTDMGRVRKLHTDSDPGGESIFFLISITMKGHWKKGQYSRTIQDIFFNDDTSSLTQLAFLSPDSSCVCPVMNPLLPWDSILTQITVLMPFLV